MKSKQAFLALIFLFVGFSVQAQRLVLEDAINLTNSYHKDYSQYPNQLEFYKALNAEIKSTIDVLNGYVKIIKKDVKCNCYSPTALSMDMDVSDGFEARNKLFTSQLKTLDSDIQKYKLKLESYKDLQYIQSKKPNEVLYYTVENVNTDKISLYDSEIKKGELEIKRNLCYLQLLMNQVDSTESLHQIIKDIHNNFSKVFTGQVVNFTSFTNYTEKSLFAMTGSAIFNTVIEGLSKFIIDRVKKEAAITATNYYQRLINKIDTNYVNLMEGIFPTTIAMFNNYEAQDINSYIQSIKKAADEDLHNMVPNVTNLVIQEKIAVPKGVWDGTVLYQTLSESSAPYEFFRNAEKQDFKTSLLDSVFNKAYVISELLLVRKSNGTITYAAPSYLDNYWENDFFKKSYVALGHTLYQPKWDFKEEDMVNIIELSSSFYKFSEAALDLSKAKSANDTTYYSRIGYMADCAIDLTEMIKKKYISNTTDIQLITEILDAFRFGNQVYKSIYRKNYLTTVNLVLTQLLEYSDSADCMADRRVLYEIASFISCVASVENSDDVKNIFENFALPVGSYSIKRKNKFSVTLDTQPGILAGITSDLNSSSQKSFAWGVTVPIGFSFNFGINSTQSNLGNRRFRNNNGLLKHSISIFVPIIDLAAPVSFLIGDTTQALQTRETSMLKPINIFSPGLFVNWGVPNAPLTVFGGFQYNPQIIKFDKVTGIESRTDNGFRFSMGISFDIPIFRIYSTRNYKVK